MNDARTGLMLYYCVRAPFGEEPPCYDPLARSQRSRDYSDGASPPEGRCPGTRRPQAEARHVDDGPRVRSRAFRRLAEAADLPDLYLRLCKRGGRQTFLRAPHRLAVGTAGKIGRASCRGRVGLYLSISVVVVSLKYNHV